MRAFATDFRSGRLAPLTFDRDANPDGHEPAIAGGVLRLAVQRGAYMAATSGEPDRCDRCELREPGKLPIAATVRHGFELRLADDFPSTPLRFVAAQLKRDGGGSPVFALRVEEGRLYADWRLANLAVEHHALGAEPRAWTSFALTFGPDGGELAVAGRRITRFRHSLEPGRKYLKLGPYRDKHPGWGDGPAAIELRHVAREILA